MATMMGNENIKRLTYEQATEQRRLDVCAYHQGANVFVAYGNLNNVKFCTISSEQCLNMNKDRDCWVSLGEYAKQSPNKQIGSRQIAQDPVKCSLN